MRELLNRALREEDGATAIEYGLIATLIGLALIGAAGAMTAAMTDTYQHVEAGVDGAIE